jgi:predicted nucleic acid-binding protein
VIAIDSPVLIDLLADGPYADAAEACLRQCLSVGPVVVCDVALAEVCGALRDGAEAMAVLEEMSLQFSPLEAKSSLRAGEMQRRYRQRNPGPQRDGMRDEGMPRDGMPHDSMPLDSMPLDRMRRATPDFLIGAHALLQCNGLITRDERFFRDYFKGLKLIVPVV